METVGLKLQKEDFVRASSLSSTSLLPCSVCWGIKLVFGIESMMNSYTKELMFGKGVVGVGWDLDYIRIHSLRLIFIYLFTIFDVFYK